MHQTTLTSLANHFFRTLLPASTIGMLLFFFITQVALCAHHQGSLSTVPMKEKIIMILGSFLASPRTIPERNLPQIAEPVGGFLQPVAMALPVNPLLEQSTVRSQTKGFDLAFANQVITSLLTNDRSFATFLYQHSYNILIPLIHSLGKEDLQTLLNDSTEYVTNELDGLIKDKQDMQKSNIEALSEQQLQELLFIRRLPDHIETFRQSASKLHGLIDTLSLPQGDINPQYPSATDYKSGYFFNQAPHSFEIQKPSTIHLKGTSQNTCFPKSDS